MLAQKTIQWILFPLLLLIIFLLAGIFIYNIFFLFSFFSFLIFCFFIWFFRDPNRKPEKTFGIISPADGKILPFRDDNKIRIFMNLHDVHVNRAPLDGKVIKMDYKKGGYKPAFSKDSDNNEQLKWTFETKDGDIELIQIAGTLVRRIEPYKKINDNVKRSERIGIIRFGSRVDLTIPKNYNLVVEAGDKVFAGKSILAIKK